MNTFFIFKKLTINYERKWLPMAKERNRMKRLSLNMLCCMALSLRKMHVIYVFIKQNLKRQSLKVKIKMKQVSLSLYQVSSTATQ